MPYKHHGSKPIGLAMKGTLAWFHRTVNALYQPVDIASLAVIRMLFGIIIMSEAFRYIDLVRIFYKFNEQTFYFKFRLIAGP